jgi:hypothetical protein
LSLFGKSTNMSGNFPPSFAFKLGQEGRFWRASFFYLAVQVVELASAELVGIVVVAVTAL